MSFEIRDKTKRIISLVLKILSYSLLLTILAVIYKEKGTEANLFKYLYSVSKILTIKSLIVSSHYSELLNDYSPSCKETTVSLGYKTLLKLVKNKNECINNYKPCGILDTYGNVLCIDEYIPCPINKIKIDHISKTYNYLSDNYKTCPLNNTSDNYGIFYSNEYTDGNAIAIIIKTKDEPKYITLNNFVLDTEEYNLIFSDLKLLNSIADIFTIDDEEKEEEEDDSDKAIKIFQVIAELDGGTNELELGLKGGKLLASILKSQYEQVVERFKNYVKNQIEILDEDNYDLFYDYLGDNFYSKNYIGFKSIDDINKFMRFDFDIYKKKFPCYMAAILALVGLIIFAGLLFFLFICLAPSLIEKVYNYYVIIVLSLIYYPTLIGFFIYTIYIYSVVHKSKTFDDLSSVQSDEFITKFIEDFISEFHKNTLIFCTIGITSISLVSDVFSHIFYYKINH